jgi:hypothetical protein
MQHKTPLLLQMPTQVVIQPVVDSGSCHLKMNGWLQPHLQHQSPALPKGSFTGPRQMLDLAMPGSTEYLGLMSRDSIRRIRLGFGRLERSNGRLFVSEFTYSTK